MSSHKKLIITCISASNLRVKGVSDMHAYAKVSVGKQKKKTTTDKEDGTDPAWDRPMSFTIKKREVDPGVTPVFIKLYSKRCCGRDKYIGKAETSVHELFNGKEENGHGRDRYELTLRKKDSDTGMLHLSCTFEDIKTVCGCCCSGCCCLMRLVCLAANAICHFKFCCLLVLCV
ncbi:uncharacterized protein LOC132274571 [Cornus florida]|uniref:uncharacterized protein LOC132274571 n=1 Tax=Cornus florida TaxID=4283 RepID=UPI002899AAAE|nr:uncharacterized protein LOC132274571 [Cornus florida]